MMNPEIVTAIGFMLLFITFQVEKGYATMLLAHIAFCIPYVMLSVMPKIRIAWIRIWQMRLWIWVRRPGRL